MALGIFNWGIYFGYGLSYAVGNFVTEADILDMVGIHMGPSFIFGYMFIYLFIYFTLPRDYRRDILMEIGLSLTPGTPPHPKKEEEEEKGLNVGVVYVVRSGEDTLGHILFPAWTCHITLCNEE